MHDDYKEQIRNHFTEALSHDMDSSPNYLTMVMIRDALIRKGVKQATADNVVTRIQVMVDDELFSDQVFMAEVTESFAEVIYRIQQVAESQFINNPQQAFINLIDGMSLTLIPPK